MVGLLGLQSESRSPIGIGGGVKSTGGSATYCSGGGGSCDAGGSEGGGIATNSVGGSGSGGGATGSEGTVEFKLSPLCDCDMPDENFFSSPCFGSCDIVKFLSVIAVELYTLVLFGVKFIVGVSR